MIITLTGNKLMGNVINQLKYGVGSPGETSNAIVTSYLEAKAKSPMSTTNELFSKVYFYRKITDELVSSNGLSDGNYGLMDLKGLLALSEECLAVFTFVLMNLDSKTFYENVAVDADLYDIVSRIIYDNVKNRAPLAILEDFDSFTIWCRMMHGDFGHYISQLMK